MEFPDTKTQALIVKLILNKRTEESIQLLSTFYNIQPPEIVVGTIKGKRKTVNAVYVGKQRRIYAINSDIFYNPLVILHEFYHHLRNRGMEHRGSEKSADKFALRFIDSYHFIKRQNAKKLDFDKTKE
ncbi:MAG TPA: hypothetical protein VHH33_10060 [Nitrososphaeraceae archaeon]|jgi:hypothetical protein|nr:hypothetical protein [Nitrososphaeraceae archaeon]